MRALFFTLVLVSLLVAAQASAAQQAYVADITIFQNDTVAINNVSVGTGVVWNETVFYGYSQLYIIRLAGGAESIYEKNLAPNFTSGNEWNTVVYMPFSPSATEIGVGRGGFDAAAARAIVKLQDTLVCNRDGVCRGNESRWNCGYDCSSCAADGVCAGVYGDKCCDPDCTPQQDLDCSCPNLKCESWENYRICPADCPPGSRDGYCDGLKDGKCDPDCTTQTDQDCQQAQLVQQPAVDYTTYALLAIIVVAAIISGVIVMRRRNVPAQSAEPLA